MNKSMSDWILSYLYAELWIIWTERVPELRLVCDPDLFEKCEELFPTERGSGALHSTGI